DSTLGWGEKGLLCFLLGRPDDWRVNSHDLARRSANGRDAVRTMLRNLVSAGYVKYTKVRADDGTIRTVVNVFEEPLRIATGAGKPGPGLPGPGFPGPLVKKETKERDQGGVLRTPA